MTYLKSHMIKKCSFDNKTALGFLIVKDYKICCCESKFLVCLNLAIIAFQKIKKSLNMYIFSQKSIKFCFCELENPHPILQYLGLLTNFNILYFRNLLSGLLNRAIKRVFSYLQKLFPSDMEFSKYLIIF